jgi:hypothetical protein
MFRSYPTKIIIFQWNLFESKVVLRIWDKTPTPPVGHLTRGR